VRGAVILGALFNVSLVVDSDNLKNVDVQFTLGVGVGVEVGFPIKIKYPIKKIIGKENFSESDVEKVEAFTGLHSETDLSIGLGSSFGDNNPKDWDLQFGSIGGGHYKTFTFSSKSKIEEQIEDFCKEDFDPSTLAD
jgi:hypothetical protein